MDKDVVLYGLNSLMCVLGFVGVFALNRLTRSIDSLIQADSDIREMVRAHREDVLTNYAKNEALYQLRSDLQQQMNGIKQDIIGRVDRLESTFKDALLAHEHRERLYASIPHESSKGT